MFETYNAAFGRMDGNVHTDKAGPTGICFRKWFQAGTRGKETEMIARVNTVKSENYYQALHGNHISELNMWNKTETVAQNIFIEWYQAPKNVGIWQRRCRWSYLCHIKEMWEKYFRLETDRLKENKNSRTFDKGRSYGKRLQGYRSCAEVDGLSATSCFTEKENLWIYLKFIKGSCSL